MDLHQSNQSSIISKSQGRAQRTALDSLSFPKNYGMIENDACILDQERYDAITARLKRDQFDTRYPKLIPEKKTYGLYRQQLEK